MYIVLFVYQNVFCSSVVLFSTFLGTILAILIGGIVSFRLQQSGYTLGVGLLALGVNLLTLVAKKTPLYCAVVYFATLLCVCALSYCIVLIGTSIRAYVLMRRAERAKIERAEQYVLPARENAYLRERLHVISQDQECDSERLHLSFSYARRALLRLRNAKLGLTERLETEELSKLFGLYHGKQAFTAEDVAMLSEAFSRLLKLSAKYATTKRDYSDVKGGKDNVN